MPIEIRELVIKATVSNESNTGSTAPPSGDKSGNAEIIKICVDKVLEILREKYGR